MTVIDFLIEVLNAHAQTLQRLAAFFGEERFIEILEFESQPTAPSELETDSDLNHLPERWFVSPADADRIDLSLAYRHLEGAVRELALPSVLEFHLWAYPYYRLIIESSIHLYSKIIIENAAERTQWTLIDQAIQQAHTWFSALPIPEPIQPQAQRAAEIPWIRFRANILKKMGRSLFTRV